MSVKIANKSIDGILEEIPQYIPEESLEVLQKEAPRDTSGGILRRISDSVSEGISTKISLKYYLKRFLKKKLLKQQVDSPLENH